MVRGRSAQHTTAAWRVSGAEPALTEGRHIRYTLKTRYRDVTTRVVFEPRDFIARLAALVPRARAHLTRFHGVFAPHSALLNRVVPKPSAGGDRAAGEQTEVEHHRALTWAKRLKRVFAIEIERCFVLRGPADRRVWADALVGGVRLRFLRTSPCLLRRARLT